MRDIKFRAWDRRNKRWLKDDDWYLHPVKGPCLYWNKEPVTNDELDIVQFTGLKDKNGKEIYESDILENNYYGKEVVQWIDNGFWCVDKNGQSHMPTQENREVIGNIYETPMG